MKNIHLILLSIFFVSGYNGISQVGINNANPSPSATLDLKSDTSGLLIPRMPSFARRAIDTANNQVNGLFVFDETDKMFYFYDSLYTYTPVSGKNDDHRKWTGLGAWRFRDNVSVLSNGSNRVDVYIDESVKNIGIGTETPEHKFHVKTGDVSIGDITITTATPIDPLTKKALSITAATNNNLYTQGSVIVGNEVVVKKTVYAQEFKGYGITPIGGIIMWSGDPTDLSDGWHLCDGSNPSPNPHAVTVPNLSGRFIVGTGKSTDGATTYTVKASGGEETHALLVTEMPSHKHGGSTSTDGAHTHKYNDKTVSREDVNGSNFNNQGIDGVPDNERTTQSGGSHSHTISSEGGGVGHENRPPYYVMAYIIRVK